MSNDRTRAALEPTPETLPYWEAGRERGKLLLQRCRDCARTYFYPRPMCPGCLSRDVDWTESAGRGRLHTFTINHRPPAEIGNGGPLIVAIVELDEGPRLMTNLIGVETDPARLRCDMPVEVVFDEPREGIALPHFRPVSEP